MWEAFAATFEVSAEGNFEGNLVLRRPFPAPSHPADSSSLDSSRRALLEVRSGRLRPGLDDKIVTAWNGLALSAWAAAARILGRPEDLKIAQDLARFALTDLWRDGQLYRTYRLGQARHPGYLDDHAALAAGLLDLYQVDFDPTWFKAALELSEVILRDFADPAGGFFDTTSEHPTSRPGQRLCRTPPFRAEVRWRRPSSCAAKLLRAKADSARRPHPGCCPCRTLFPVTPRPLRPGWRTRPGRVSSASTGPGRQTGKRGFPAPSGPVTQDLPSEADPRRREAWRFPPLLKGKTMIEGRATAYLCRDFICKVPTTSADELQAQLLEAK